MHAHVHVHVPSLFDRARSSVSETAHTGRRDAPCTYTPHTRTLVCLTHTRDFSPKESRTEPAANSSHTGAGLQRSRWLQDGPVPRARHASPVCDPCPPRSETVRTHQLSACANISANILSKSFGFVRWGYRPRTCPSRPTTNLVKFHSIFSPSSGVPFRNL